jgi:Zn-dependent peptidase ImmA (M78 family)
MIVTPDEIDAQASEFAMCLLIPPHFLKKEIDKIGGKIDLVDDPNIKILAHKFKVTDQMMITQIAKLEADFYGEAIKE